MLLRVVGSQIPKITKVQVQSFNMSSGLIVATDARSTNEDDDLQINKYTQLPIIQNVFSYKQRTS